MMNATPDRMYKHLDSGNVCHIFFTEPYDTAHEYSPHGEYLGSPAASAVQFSDEWRLAEGQMKLVTAAPNGSVYVRDIGMGSPELAERMRGSFGPGQAIVMRDSEITAAIAECQRSRDNFGIGSPANIHH